jgi:hypothetical protein
MNVQPCSAPLACAAPFAWEMCPGCINPPVFAAQFTQLEGIMQMDCMNEAHPFDQ